MTFKFEILKLGQKMKMDINKFSFIYLPIMNEFSFNYLFNPKSYTKNPYEKNHLSIHSSM